MTPTRVPTPTDVRDAVRRWIGESWDPELSLVEWRRRLVDAGWAVPSWPTQLSGRGLPAWADDIVPEELRRAGAVGLPMGGGMNLAAPTIMTHGPDPMRERFLRTILTGEETWCQLFSEPGAGSDLAGATTTALEFGRQGAKVVVHGTRGRDRVPRR